jgi:hypothetical protein
MIAVVCVLCLGASLLNSEEPKGEQPGQVGRSVQWALSAGSNAYVVMDTTNGKIWALHENHWEKVGPSIPEQNAEANKQAAVPDPTGKLRPKPEEDFNKERVR